MDETEGSASTLPTFNSGLCYCFRTHMGASAGSDAFFATDAFGLRSGTFLFLAAGGCDARLSAVSETR